MKDNSLLNGVEAEQEEKTIDQIEEESSNNELEKASSRPDFVDPEFWDQDNNKVKEEDLFKAFNAEKEKALGLRRKLSEKGSVKPPKTAEEYSLNESLNELLPSDSPAVSILKEKAFKAGLSKDQFNDFVSELMPALNEKGLISKGETELSDEEKQQQFNDYKNAELAKLGKEGPMALQKLANWGDSLVNKGVISRDEKPVFEAMITDAPSIVLLNKLMSLTGESSIPVKTAVLDGLPSRQEIDQIIASPEYANGEAKAHRIVKDYFEKTA
jgi:hypothetical protein